MRIIDQEVEFWGVCPHEYQPMIERIEKAARVCYRSEPVGDPETFINAKLLKPTPPHFSVLEHSNLVGRVIAPSYPVHMRLASLFKSKWIQFHYMENDVLYICGNLRAWMEVLQTRNMADVFIAFEQNGLEIVPPESQPRETKRVTVKLITDRAVLAEITRHRDDTAFSVQSQRYVDYKDQVHYIKPAWYDDAADNVQLYFHNSCIQNEYDYKRLRTFGLLPQDARAVLSNQVATEIVMTAFLPQWDWILNLRRAKPAYPQMRLAMDGVYNHFSREGMVG